VGDNLEYFDFIKGELPKIYSLEDIVSFGERGYFSGTASISA
jgi:hypothetical protein